MQKIHTTIIATLCCLLLAVALVAPAGATEQGVVNVNTGTLEQLCLLPGIGQHTASRIISYREANGPFQSVDDLQQVKGIGTATLERLRSRCVIDGQTTLQPDS